MGWDGRSSAYTAMKDKQAGITSVLSVSSGVATKSIVFAVPFDAVPSCKANAVTSVPGTVVVDVEVNNVTTTGFDIVLYRTGTATVTGLHWSAIRVTQ